MKKKIIKLFIFLLMVIGIWRYIEYNNKSIDDEINQNKYATIAKVYEIKYGARNKSALFKYNYQGRIYRSSQPLKGFYHEDKVNKYFVLHLSTKNPELSKIFFDREIRDTVLINNSEMQK